MVELGVADAITSGGAPRVGYIEEMRPKECTMVDHESSRTNEGEEQSIRVLTFGWLLEAIASNEGIAQKARADICSGVRSLCHALGLLIESTPADPRIIAERLSGLTPVAARMSPAAFGTAAAIWIGRLSTRIIVSAAVETSGPWLR